MKQRAINEQIAKHLFGWRWVSFTGRPINSHPTYDTHKTTRVRLFVSPALCERPDWQKFFNERQMQPATGEEPLSYGYCSSFGTEPVPDYAGNECYLVLKQAKKLWKPSEMWEAFKRHLPVCENWKPDSFARAALAVIECET